MTYSDEAAFPLFRGADQENASGLTKREYFAAMALQGLIAQAREINPDHEWVASEAVELADTLMDALNVDPEKTKAVCPTCGNKGNDGGECENDFHLPF